MIRLLGLALLVLAAALPPRAQRPALVAVAPPAPLGLTVGAAYGDTLHYDFGPRGDAERFALDVAFRPTEVEWRERWENGTTEVDPTRSVRLDAHRLLASWPEQNGWFVTLYADFAAGAASFCANRGGDSQCRAGTITRRDARRTADPPPAPVYTILEATVHDDATYQRYRDAVAPIIAEHGGRYLVRAGAARLDASPSAQTVSPEGDWRPDRIVVIEWPSRAALDAFVASPESRAAAALRAASSTTRSVVVNGYDGH